VTHSIGGLGEGGPFPARLARLEAFLGSAAPPA
jgi:hypothetical protein